MKEIGTVQFSKETYTDANMLLNYDLVKPAYISRSLTKVWGEDNNRWTFLNMLGQSSVSKTPINAGDSQYKWKIKGRKRVTSQVVRLVSSTTKPGLGYSEFEVEFRDNWLIYQWGAMSPDGCNLVRIQSEGKKLTNGNYLYVFQLQTGDANAYIDLSNFEAGKHWSIAAPTIPSSKSDGNRSHSMTWSEATNQFSWHRYSKQIAGNVANIVVDFEFNVEGGGTTNLWMPYEQKLFELEMRDTLEEDIIYSEYNRDANGVIHLKDPENGEVIPRGNGIRAILKSVNNHETFSKLTLEKVDNALSRIYDNRDDATPTEIVLYGGKGFLKLFSNAIENEAVSKGYFQALGEARIKSGGSYLSYGGYFRQYETQDGILVTAKVASIFDKGSRAEADRLNGYVYDGLPLTSYTGVFLDHSLLSNGERNVQLVYEEGREYQVGIYKGMSPLPSIWGAAAEGRIISTPKDIASYEVITSQGVNILNPTTSFWMELSV